MTKPIHLLLEKIDISVIGKNKISAFDLIGRGYLIGDTSVNIALIESTLPQSLYLMRST